MKTDTDEKDRVRSAIAAVDPKKMASVRNSFDKLLEQGPTQFGLLTEVSRAIRDYLEASSPDSTIQFIDFLDASWLEAADEVLNREVHTDKCEHRCYCCPRTYTHSPTLEVRGKCEVVGYICGGCLLLGESGTDPRSWDEWVSRD